jgi:hypothetical protein
MELTENGDSDTGCWSRSVRRDGPRLCAGDDGAAPHDQGQTASRRQPTRRGGPKGRHPEAKSCPAEVYAAEKAKAEAGQ